MVCPIGPLGLYVEQLIGHDARQSAIRILERPQPLNPSSNNVSYMSRY